METIRKRPLGRPRLESRPAGALPTPERILEAATELFCDVGFSGASMAAIAERADLTSGAIYAHFKSKAELLLAVVRRAIEASPLNELGAADSGRSAAGQIPGLVAMYADPERRRLRRLAVELHAAAARDKGVADVLADGNRTVVDAYREHIDPAAPANTERSAARLASANDPNADYSARLMLILTMGLSHLETLDPALIGDAQFRRWLEQVVAGVLRGGHEETT